MKKNIIGFIVAMEKEARLLLNISNITKEYMVAGKRIFEGTIWDDDFVLILAGIGKVNAGMSTQILLDRYSIDKLINFGLAGGKAESGLKAGDIVEIVKSCQYDFDLSELDPVNIGYMQDYDLTYYPLETTNKFPSVKCATGDRFTSKKMYLDIIHNLQADITDMECGAIAQVAYANNVKLHSIKLISDVDGENESIFAQYSSNAKDICDKIPNAIKLLLKK